ncbi:hypothetical protein [Nonomuraea sp. NPDC050643]|uniref:hypothetical protein n=1 Tax=Nonomuraea sp. NPDC050643 TaxID=3155660 RepID=UPI00340B9D20
MKDEIKFKTAGGNTVIWKRTAGANSADDPWGSYTCGGCGKEKPTYLSAADKHARECRAL